MVATPPAGISVRELTKRYESLTAVQGVSFDVAPGEIFGLLGPNGAGKTTTIECILGLRRPDSGVVTIDGVDVLRHPEAARQAVGAQLQDASLQDKISPREAIGLFASFYQKPAGTDDLLKRFGLVAKADSSFDSLSGGQRQRLFLALAFVNNPRVVVLDEPTAGLDPPSRRDLHRLVVRAREDGRTILLSTHNLEEAQQLCDRIAIIDHGRILAISTPAALIEQSKTPPRVFIRTARPLTGAEMQDLPGVVGADLRDGGWVLGTREVTQTIVGLTRHLEGAGNELLDLQIHRPTLEDVFLEITGRAWEPDEPATTSPVPTK